VRWMIADDRLKLVWRETVTRPLPEGDRVGFGTTVLKTMVRQSLGAEVERLCHDDGIEWRFAVPLSAIDPDRAPLGADDAPSE
jgi:two-component sensor histidine kinase